MKIPLTDRQREFLNTCIKLYREGELKSMPIKRVDIILRNGYYYEHNSSFKYYPKGMRPESIMTDKNKLNHLAERIRTYYITKKNT